MASRWRTYQRKTVAAKVVNFGLLYGQAAKGLVLFHRIEFAQYCGLNERHIGLWPWRDFTAA